MPEEKRLLPPYRASLAGTLLAAREAVMAPIRPILREAGVTEQQWRLLRVLSDEGACDASRLADIAMLHAPSVTRILKELADRKLIVREADPSDGRRAVVTISASGRALVKRVGKKTRVLLDAYAGAFGKKRLAALQNELVALARAAGGVGANLDAAVEREI